MNLIQISGKVTQMYNEKNLDGTRETTILAYNDDGDKRVWFKAGGLSIFFEDANVKVGSKVMINGRFEGESEIKVLDVTLCYAKDAASSHINL